MVTYNKFQDFGSHLLQGNHDLDASGDAVEIYLTAATPSASADSAKADLAEIASAGGYTGAKDAQNSLTEATGVWRIDVVDVTFTAAATGTFPTFRYVASFNESMTTPGDVVTDGLISWWDNGSTVTLNNNDTFTVDFQNNRLFTINSAT